LSSFVSTIRGSDGAIRARALAVCVCAAFCGLAFSQEQYSTPKQRIKYVRDVAGQGGANAVSQIAPYLKDPDVKVRIEAAKSIAELGTQASLDPLTQALSDNDPEVQIRATDGLVNFYLPGYLQTGIRGSVKRMRGAISSRFTGDDFGPMIPSYVSVRPEVVQALGKVATGGSSMDSREHAVVALGILRGRAALPDLIAALRTKDSDVIYQALISIQKINDPSAAPPAAFLVRDLIDKVQLAALETQGLLRNQSALPQIRDVFAHPRNQKGKEAALAAIAQMPEPADRDLFGRSLTDKDTDIRTAAAEGLGRLKDPADRQTVQSAFDEELKEEPRMALAFAAVMLGNRDMTEFAPFRYLVNELNSAAWSGVSLAYLTEIARDPEARASLYPVLKTATADEKKGLAQVLSVSGDSASLPYLETLSRDPDSEVAKAGFEALRSLRSRFPH
jgi:HEAT repeat protein